MNNRSLPQRHLARAIALLFATTQIAQAQIVATPIAGPTQPRVDAAANGVPLLQITAPSAAGVSRNQYQQFDVSSKGAVLNNSTGLVQTQQAGWVDANPNLGSTSARIILNEVTSAAPSALRGYVEVAGQKAQVVIANPNGITCDGCGFINTSRATLTTGIPVFGGSGSLDAFRVTTGQINLQGAGLNASNIDRVDLLARAIQINAGLWAGELNVIAGANQVNYADLGMQVIAPASTAPTFAIDVASLGGMYANKIRLVGTEAGVGVHSQGTLTAQAGEFSLDARGVITLAGTTSASGNVTINSTADITSSGVVSSLQAVAVSSSGTFTQSGMLTAGGNLDIAAQTTEASGTLGAGIDAGGQAAQAGSLNVTALGSARLAGRNLAGSDFSVSAASLDLTGAQTLAGNNVHLVASNGNLDHRGGTLSAGGGVTLSASGALRNDAGLVQGATLDVTANSLGNQGGALYGATRTDVITTGVLDNSAGGYLGSGGALTLSSGLLNNAGSGSLIRGATIDIIATSIGNQGGTFYGASAANITTPGIVNNSGGGLIRSDGSLTLASAALDNTGGSVIRANTLDINANSINNQGGTLYGITHATVSTIGTLDNSLAGLIRSDGDLTLTSAALNNAQGGVIRADTLSINATSIDNTDGTLYGIGHTTVSATAALDNSNNGLIQGDTLDLNADSINNQGGVIYGVNRARIATPGSFDNSLGGLIRSDNTLRLSSGPLNNSGSGSLIRGNTLDITATSIDNQGGTIYGISRANITSDSTLDNSAGGLIRSDGTLTLRSALLDNVGSGSLIRGNMLDITASTITNAGGAIYGTSSASIVSSGAVDNSSAGFIGGDGDLTITATGIDNSSGGSLVASGNLTFTATSGTLNNHAGSVVAGGALDISTAQSFQYLNGDTLRGDNGIALTSAANLTIGASARLESMDDITLNAAGTLSNLGTIVSDTSVNLNAATLTNSGSVISGSDIAALFSGSASNSGSFASQRGLVFAAASLGNTASGSLQAVTDFTLTTSSAFVNQGTISGNNIGITAPGLDNQGAIAAMNDFTATISGQFINRSGNLVYTGRDQLLYVGSLYNEEDGVFWAGRNIVIQKSATGARSTSVTNHLGQIEAQNELVIRANTLANQGSLPTIQTTTTTDAIPYYVGECPGPNNPGCVPQQTATPITDTFGNPVYDTFGNLTYTYTPITNAAGEQIYYSAWGFREATLGEINAFYLRNPNAAYVFGGTDIKNLPNIYSPDAHTRELAWSVSSSSVEQSAVPGSITKPARLLAGQDFIFDGGDLSNVGSQISANRDVTLTGNTLTNQGQDLQRTTTVNAGYYILSAGRHLLALPLYTTTTTENIGTVPSSITAGRTLSGNLTGSLINDSNARPALNTRSAQNNVATGAALPSTPVGNLLTPGSNGGTVGSGSVNGGSAGSGAVGGSVSLTGGVQLVNGQLDTHSVTLPSGTHGLYVQAPPGAHYLIETNPLFTQRNNFISSDYFLTRLGLDPAATEMRLGDGYYEQNLVRDQIFALTGRRYLADERDGMAQYQALMDAGVAAAQSLHLSPGIALTAQQIAALTGNIVWLVEQVVDGQKVLVPQVYLSQVTADALQPSGALLAANDITLTASDVNNGGRISAKTSVSLSSTNDLLNRGVIETTAANGNTRLSVGRDLVNAGGTIAGGDVTLNAGRDLINRADSFSNDRSADFGQHITDTQVGAAGRILAGNNATLTAGRDIQFQGGQLATGSASGVTTLTAARDINLGTITQQTSVDQTSHGGHVSMDRTAQGGSIINTAGSLSISAGQDINVTGSQAAAGTTLNANAGRNLTVTAATDNERGVADLAQGDGGSHHDFDRGTVKGSSLSAGGNITLTAAGTSTTPSPPVGEGRGEGVGQGNLTISASTISSTAGDITLAASRDVTIDTQNQHQSDNSTTWGSSSGLIGSSSHREEVHTDSNTAIGSSVSGERVNIVSGRDTAVSGSSIVGSGNVTLAASNKLTLDAAENTQSNSSKSERSQSGVFTSGAGITLGQQQQKQTADGDTVTRSGSTVGSVGGNVTLVAGESYTQKGSNVLAPAGDIAIAAPKVDIEAVYDTASNKQTFEQKQSGITLAVSSPIISAAQTAQQMSEAAGQTSDPRMKALAAASIALDVYNNAKPISDAASALANGNPAGAVSISLSVGSSQSKLQSSSNSSSAVGSTVAAGNNLNITATGTPSPLVGEGRGEGDITVTGSALTAGNNATLAATGNLNLQAAASTSNSQSTSSGSSASVGVSIGAQTGITVAGSQSKGNSNGSDTIYTNTSVTAGNTANLSSGQDTTLKGATVSAKQVIADVGGNLAIESLQDTSTYQAKSSSIGGSVTIGPAPGGNLSIGASKINSNYQSVTEQSAIHAGDAGFQVSVQGNTDLKGGAITSAQVAIDQQKNSFTTGGTLALSDIQNKADYKGEAIGVNLGAGTSLDGKLAPSGSSAGFGQDSGSASSTTQAAISGIAGNKDARTGDKETGIQQIFDANKVQREINAQVQITQAFGQQASKAVESYVQDQRKGLQKQMKAAATEGEKAELQKQLSDLALQERVMNVLIGAVTGMADTALAKEGLSAAADQMRQLTLENSKIFAGVTDGKTVLTNLSGESEGVRGDNAKSGGVRVDLDLLCGAANERCLANPDGTLAYKDGMVQWNAKDKDGRPISLSDFLETDEGKNMGGATGGIQGWKGTLFGVPYVAGSWQDKLIESFGGTHDMIGGQLSGLYDEQGNIKRGMTAAEKFAYDRWSEVAIPIATPFAAAELLPPEVWQAIGIFLRAAK